MTYNDIFTAMLVIYVIYLNIRLHRIEKNYSSFTRLTKKTCVLLLDQTQAHHKALDEIFKDLKK